MNEVPFVLPVGLQAADGRVYRDGLMRRALALDEIEPLGDERVRRNEAYYPLLVLARVITRLGPFGGLNADTLALLPAVDFAHLQDLYASVNTVSGLPSVAGYTAGALRPPLPMPSAPALPTTVETECPHCGALLELDLSPEAVL